MLLEGLQLGRYHLLQVLGSGGMGEVYLAEDTHIHRQIAIKVIRFEATPYPNIKAAKDATRLFQHEIKAIALLNHPHILPLFDYGEENFRGTTLTYMVMPYLTEGSLSTWMRQRSDSELLSPQEVLHIIHQAAAALRYAHQQNIIHQDVKPANFLIRSDEENPNLPDLLLSDFGIAKFTTASASVSQSSRGTPVYMAPEQWNGQPVPATDQYALAVMTYQLLTGSPPFQGRQEQIMYLHFHTTPQPPSALNPKLSKDCDTVLLHALAKKPEERFASISAFVRALSQVLSADEPKPTLFTNLGKTDRSDIHTILAVSDVEANAGTRRVLTVPGGRQISISLPAGMHDGQIIRLEDLVPPVRNSQSAGALILTIAIAPVEKHTFIPSSNNDPTVVKTSSVIDASGPREVSIVPRINSENEIIGRLRSLSKVRAALFIGLVLLVIGGSVFYFKYYNLVQRNYLLNVTAPNPYPPNRGTLSLNDPLSDNSNGYFWSEDSNSPGNSCIFSGGTYHISSLQKGVYTYCVNIAGFNNFAYEVQMTIVKGNGGGIVFRENDTNRTFYYFHIDNTGSYAIDIVTNDAGAKIVRNLGAGTSTAINTGLNQSNLIAVVANDSSLDLYVNRQKITSVSDSTYSHGQIGVAAADASNPTEVEFSDARVWAL